jgi:AcrR family transcriptional regulator
MSPRPNIDHIRRPQILAAAAEVIAERGISASRVADIAERAGTSTSAVLYWFGSKEGLLAEALTWEDDLFYEQVTKLLAEAETPPQRLITLIEASSSGGGWTLWMELWGRALRDPGAADAREKGDIRWRETIAEVVRDGCESGDFKAEDPDYVALTLSALLDGLAVQVTLDDPEVTAERMMEIGRRSAASMVSCELPESSGRSLEAA